MPTDDSKHAAKTGAPRAARIHPDVASTRDTGAIGTGVEKQEIIPVWDERRGAPPGSTAESLLIFDHKGDPEAVAPPTHYHHLANGRVVGGYTSGTHHTEVDDDGNDVITPIINVYGA